MVRSTQLGKKFGFERLEARTVLNGTVMVDSQTTSPGTLTIAGDSSANIIVIHQTGKNIDGDPIIQVLGAGTKLNNLDNGKTGTSFTFGSVSGDDITSINIAMAGGNDVVTFTNTTVDSTITVDMGDGNNVLTMVNVHTTDDAINVSLGDGTNVASLVKVGASFGFSLDAGNGRNVIVLNAVSAGAEQDFSVSLGSGKTNVVTVVNCSGGDADFFDDGVNGILTGVGNHFDSHTVDTFRFRFGDLKNDT
jgi:hypothetical protein